ncbi:MAG: ComF family protein [Phycisphaeraceae bacterium]
MTPGRLCQPAIRLLRGTLDELMPDHVAAALAESDWHPDAPEVYCPRCGASAGPGAVTQRGCSFCLDHAVAWQRLVRLGAYREPLDGWIRQMKFRRRWRWGEQLGRWLADRVPEPFEPAKTLVCSVPMPWRRRCVRGYNQSAVIARSLAEARDWRQIEVLRRTRHARPQTSVTASARAANIRRSFGAGRVDLTGWEVVLVDDIKTTGATLTQCARLLRQAGARCVYAAVAAVADPRGSDFRAR